MTVHSAIENFKIGLYVEHLEEASALYDLRRALLAEPDREWRSLQDFEERLEAHIDALVIGGRLALQVCAEKMRDGDAGELFAGLCVCCRQLDVPLFAAMWRQLDFAESERVRAVTEALKFELPVEWSGACEQAIADGDAGRSSILSVAASYRRLPVGSQIAARLAADDQIPDPNALWALGRLQGAEAMAVFTKRMRSPDSDVRRSALHGLLLGGDEQALKLCYSIAQSEDWPHLEMGLGGDRQAVAILKQVLEAGRGSRQTVLALGLLGDLSAVRTLIALLASEELAETAARALHWITGAPLYEDVFVAEPVEESELFVGERAAWLESGAVPRRADGRPYGAEIRRLTRDPAIWNQWLTEHAREFDVNLRYRRGQLYGPRELLKCLTTPLASAELRQLAHDELIIRYRCHEPFECDARVVDQFAWLKRIAHWVQEVEKRFEGSR